MIRSIGIPAALSMALIAGCSDSGPDACPIGWAGDECDRCADGYAEFDGDCLPTTCEVPQAQVLAVVHAGAVLEFSTVFGLPVQVGTSADPDAAEPDLWLDKDRLRLPGDDTPYSVKVFARVDHESCTPDRVFSWVYEVRDAYPPPAGQPYSTAVGMDDPRIASWASGYEDVIYGEDLDAEWKTPENALGPAEGTSLGVVCLGRGGSIVLGFDPPIADGRGYDFAVFENAIDDAFLELGVVEVSTDGVLFVRFDHAFLGQDPIGAFGALDTAGVGSLAGKYRQGHGTPFDLHVFVNTPEVRRGLLDLDLIRYVKIVDVVGDGGQRDSFGHPIYDPYPTSGSAGFDLDAIGVLNTGD